MQGLKIYLRDIWLISNGDGGHVVEVKKLRNKPQTHKPTKNKYPNNVTQLSFGSNISSQHPLPPYFQTPYSLVTQETTPLALSPDCAPELSKGPLEKHRCLALTHFH